MESNWFRLAGVWSELFGSTGLPRCAGYDSLHDRIWTYDFGLGSLIPWTTLLSAGKRVPNGIDFPITVGRTFSDFRAKVNSFGGWA